MFAINQGFIDLINVEHGVFLSYLIHFFLKNIKDADEEDFVKINVIDMIYRPGNVTASYLVRFRELERIGILKTKEMNDDFVSYKIIFNNEPFFRKRLLLELKKVFLEDYCNNKMIDSITLADDTLINVIGHKGLLFYTYLCDRYIDFKLKNKKEDVCPITLKELTDYCIEHDIPRRTFIDIFPRYGFIETSFHKATGYKYKPLLNFDDFIVYKYCLLKKDKEIKDICKDGKVVGILPNNKILYDTFEYKDFENIKTIFKLDKEVSVDLLFKEIVYSNKVFYYLKNNGIDYKSIKVIYPQSAEKEQSINTDITEKMVTGKLVRRIEKPHPEKKTKSEKIRSKKKALKVNHTLTKPVYKRENTVPLDVCDEILEIIDYWNSLGLHFFRFGFKYSGKTVYALKRIMKGTFFVRHIGENELFDRNATRKFSQEDMITIFDRYAKMAIDPEYLPELLPEKNKLKNRSLIDFLYSPGSKGVPFSWFLQCYEEEPKKRVAEIDEINPEITDKVKKYWIRVVNTGIEQDFTTKDIFYFKKISNNICLTALKYRISDLPYGEGKADICLKHFFSFVRDYFGQYLGMIKPSQCVVDNLWKIKFVVWMTNKGIIEVKLKESEKIQYNYLEEKKTVTGQLVW